MTEKAKRPAIRFKGYTDAWEQRKLGDFFEERNERSGAGELISVTIGSGIQKYTELGRFDTKPSDMSKYKRVEIGDIAYNSMRMWQGASGYSPYSGILSPAYTVIAPRNGVSSLFFSYLIKRPQLIHLFQIHSQGLTPDTWNLKYPAFSQIEASAPHERDEQERIAGVLSKVDNLITLHQRKYDQLVSVKKSLLEKMFPSDGEDVPKIRFKGFTDAWEQRKVGEVATIIGGNAWKSSEYASDGEYLVVTIANVSGDVYINDSIGNHIACSAPREFLLQRDDVLVSLTGNVGRVSKMTNIKGVLNQRVGKISSTENQIRPQYLFHILRNPHFERKMIEAGQGAAQKNIGNTDVLTYEFYLPLLLMEQDKIAKILDALDDLITLHQRKLEKLKNIKKALLEKMFV